jgi:hypothetical protein
MMISYTADLADGRALKAIGRVRAASRWRAARGPGGEPERQAALEALKREAEEFGADAVVDVRFEMDGVKDVDVGGVLLQRVAVTGLAVRFAKAA